MRLYLAASTVWLIAYSFLPDDVQPLAFLATALGAVPCVCYGLVAVRPGKRLPWWLLLAALSALNLGLLVRLDAIGLEALGVLLNACGNALLFAAAVALILRCGRNDIGGVVDATIVGVALGGVLATLIEAPAGSDRAVHLNLFVVLFALSGVLGALVRIAMVLTQPVAALWWLMISLSSALIADVVQATAGPDAENVVNLLFMVAYTCLGAVGLHPQAPRLVRPGFVARDDSLSIWRLAFLGAVVAVVPVVVGLRILLHATEERDGAVIVVATVAIGVLVMLRIGRLSADRSRAVRALQQQASADPLTGLPNRRTFLSRLTMAVHRRERCAVVFCDLDGFKAINDRWGHGVGDEVLARVGARLAAAAGEENIASRFGGDEFLILIEDATPARIEDVVRGIRESFGAPLELSVGPIAVGLSVGVAVSAGQSADALVRAADGAMYQAKRTNGILPSVRVAA